MVKRFLELRNGKEVFRTFDYTSAVIIRTQKSLVNRLAAVTENIFIESILAIRDAILTSLSSQTRDQVAPEKGREKLKAQIKKNVNTALGEEDVQGVYFTNFVTQ